jgi:hypothetical protein
MDNGEDQKEPHPSRNSSIRVFLVQMPTLVLARGQRSNPEDRADRHGALRLAMKNVIQVNI